MLQRLLIKYLRKGWKILFAINLSIIFLILYPFTYLLIQSSVTFPIAFKLKKLWAEISLYSVGIELSVKREGKLKKDTAYIFCVNHTSYIDILISLAVIPQYFHFMGKAELKKVPLFGEFFKRMDIAVDRDNRAASYKAFIKAGTDIDKKISILIYPESTFSDTPPALRPFKNGAFKLAIEKQIPVVPITFLNSWEILPCHEGASGGKPGTAHVVIHKPIETVGLRQSDIQTLKKMVSEVIESPFNSAL